MYILIFFYLFYWYLLFCIIVLFFFFSSRRRHTRCALVTGVQTCALPIWKLIRPSEAGRLINQIAAVAEMPKRLPAIQRSRDPRDDFLLGLCEAGRADWLVTGDKADLLALDRHGADRKSTRLHSSH